MDAPPRAEDHGDRRATACRLITTTASRLITTTASRLITTTASRLITTTASRLITVVRPCIPLLERSGPPAGSPDLSQPWPANVGHARSPNGCRRGAGIPTPVRAAHHE